MCVCVLIMDVINVKIVIIEKKEFVIVENPK